MGRLMVVVLLLLTGCTSVTAKRVKPNDYDTAGLRYYLPAPYLLVTKPVEINRREEILVFAAPFVKLEKLCEGECRTEPAVPEVSASSPAATPSPSPTPSAQSSRRKTGNGDKDKVDKGDTGQDEPEGAEKIGEPAGDDEPNVNNEPPPEPAKEKPEKTTEEKPKNEVKGDGDSGEDSGEEDEAIKLVWLPDPCREMALQTTNNLAKLKTSITFTDGWKLTQIDAESDATDVVKELIGLAGTLIDARKAVRIAELGGEEEEEEETPAAQGETVSTTTAAPYFLRKTTVMILKPGLYQILLYKEGCDKEPSLAPDILAGMVDSVSYSPATKKP